MAQLENRYSVALFELALEKNELPTISEEASVVRNYFVSDKQFFQIFCHPQISTAEKKAMIRKAFGEDVSDTLKGFFEIVINKRREQYILSIIDSFLRRVDEYNGVTKAKVYAPTALSEDQRRRLQTQLESKLNKKVDLELVLDSSLIGGLIVEADGYVFDGSVKKHFEDIKRSVL